MTSVKNFTMEDAKTKLLELGKSQGTVKSYTGKWKIIANSFPKDLTLKKGFSEVDRVLAFIYSKSESPSTRKTYLSAYKALLDLFDFPATSRNTVSKLIKTEQENTMVEQAIKNQSPPFSIQEAKDMFLDLNKKYKEFKAKAKKENGYGNASMASAYLLLILKHGVLRSDELANLRITEKPEKNFNSISKDKGTLTIVDHKNMKSMGTVVTQLGPEILQYIKKATEGTPFIHQLKKKPKYGWLPYQSGDGVTKMLHSHIGYNNHKIRDAKTSIVLNSNDKKRRDDLKHYQMHSLETQLTHYTKHIGGASEEVYENNLFKDE